MGSDHHPDQLHATTEEARDGLPTSSARRDLSTPGGALLDPRQAHAHTSRCYWDLSRCAWHCPPSAPVGGRAGTSATARGPRLP